jgi:hypothetical protein
VRRLALAAVAALMLAARPADAQDQRTPDSLAIRRHP